MTKATSKHTTRDIRTIVGGPVQRPYPGVRNVPAKEIQRAVKELFRDRAIQERAAQEHAAQGPATKTKA